MLLQDLAERLGCRLEGDGRLEITRVASLDQAGPGDLTFFANPKYGAALRRTRAGAVILPDDAPAVPCAMLRTNDPYLAFANALQLLVQSEDLRQIAEEWKRIWFTDQPSHMTYDRIHGGIQ